MNKIILLMILSIISYFNRDPYKVLKVKKSASHKDINESYLKLKKEIEEDDSYYYSSDLDTIKRAHEILSHRGKRQIYDIKGINGVNEYEYGLRTGQNHYRTGNEMQFNLELTLEEMYKGTSKNINFNRMSVCHHCKGKGAAEGGLQMCHACHGEGQTIRQVRTDMGYMQFQETCQHCGGSGHIIKQRCPICGGERVVHEEKSLKIEVPKGSKNNEVFVFEGESHSRPEFLPANVLVKIKEIDDKFFKRNNNDLIYELTINLKEAIKGFQKKIKHLDDRWISVNKEDVSNNGDYIKIKGEGMPIRGDYNTFGDLFVKIKVELPKYLSQKAKEHIKNIFK